MSKTHNWEKKPTDHELDDFDESDEFNDFDSEPPKTFKEKINYVRWILRALIIV